MQIIRNGGTYCISLTTTTSKLKNSTGFYREAKEKKWITFM